MIRTLRHALPALAVAASLAVEGCDDGESQFAASSPPRLQALIAGKTAPLQPNCTLFPPDETRGQIAKHKEIVITNTGAAVGKQIDKLCVKWGWTKANSQFKVTIVQGATKDEAYCASRLPGSMAALAVNTGKLVLDIEYLANESGDTDPLVLTLESNDVEKKIQKYCFGVGSAGTCANVSPSEYKFTNANPAQPPTACFNLTNCGSATLTFQGAEFTTDNSQYEIVEQPNAGEGVPPKGDPLNPDGSKSIKICVRYKPDATAGNEDVILKVSTNASSGPSQVLIGATTQEEAKWWVECADASGKTGYTFSDPTKSESKKCKICNAGPTGLKLQDVKAAAVNTPADDAKVAAAFYCRVVDINGVVLQTSAVNAGKCLDVVCDYTSAGATKPPPANCHISHSSGGGPSGALYLPIQVGGCDTPEWQFAPTPELWLQAKPGASASGTVTVSNQSCAPLQIVTACITSAGYKGKEPCQAPSKNHALDKAFSPVGLAGFGQHALGVVFSPDAKITVKTAQDLLHISYCTGVWASGQCAGGTIETRALNLFGAVAFDGAVTAPTSACQVATAGALKVGAPVAIKNTVPKKGSFENQSFYFRWFVSKRPAGSATWLPEGQQSTDQIDTVKLLPDVAGDYEVVCQVQGVDNQASEKNAWSPQASVQFTVAPK